MTKKTTAVLLRPADKGKVRLSRAIQSEHTNTWTPQAEPEPVVLTLKEATAVDWLNAIKGLVK